MRFVVVLVFLIIVTIGSFFVAYEKKQIPHDSHPLHAIQKKFMKVDIDNPNINLDAVIKEIKEARKIYPLDDKLKMLDMRLEHKKANQSYKSTKY
ncbi:MAG: hypothetical protein ACI9TV_001743 [Sulfurimonas sp.]|uniref:hypothetical protein n=1 Tax=Sulfurimonas sp. TaxID=2022749 RepID=UPI0039E681D0